MPSGSGRLRICRFNSNEADVAESRRKTSTRNKALAIASCLAVALSLGGNPAAAEPAVPTFELDIQPVLSAAGCNAGACHGKARGQNGFALSLLGFDAEFDYRAIVMEARGRRVSPASPGASLLLQKAAAAVPHGGGERLPAAGEHYALLRAWIAGGMPRTPADAPQLTHIALDPPPSDLEAGEAVELSVTAHYSDGGTRQVTSLTDFQSNEPAIVAVSDAGVVTAGSLPGEATIMARYMGVIATWGTAIPLPGEVDPAVYSVERRNFIDDLVLAKLEKLGIVPSEPCDDTQFLRRAYLDVIGRLPRPSEARAFLADADPEKRARLIDALLERPEYADYWANKWCDLLRPNPFRVGVKATFNFDGWIRDAFRRNLPYDQFVRELLTAEGSTWENGATVLFRDRREPEELTTIVSQLFLGIRLECAKCHHHPFEVYGQDDFYSFAAYFSRIGRKGVGISPPISGGEELVFTADSGEVRHPLTGEVLPPRPLFGEAVEIPSGDDPRAALVDWLLSEGNPFPAQVAANRIWADLMGRGLVEPIDDLRATNPASNPALLAALGQEFRRLDYDQKQFIRAIATSHVYGLSSQPGKRNAGDYLNYSRHYRKRLRAELLLDAIGDITGLPDHFDGTAEGTRAVEIWTHRVESTFLNTFGRPDPNQDPPCERTSDGTVVQALHLMNAPQLHAKVTSDEGTAARLAGGEQTPAAIVEELYLLAYSRLPMPEESQSLVELYAAHPEERRQVTEDILWAMLNSPEFLFKD